MINISIEAKFNQLKQDKKCALIPFITAGDPNLDVTAKALKVLDQNGADFIELGVPYSDPLADGPVIQAAATRALQKGTRLDSVLELAQSVIPTLNAPIILFTYYNPILNRGIPNFIRDIALVGVKGLVVPDLPWEEASLLMKPAREAGIEVILLIAPTSSIDRIKAIANLSQGFIYLVSVTGVTGMREGVSQTVQDKLALIRSLTDKPIGVGFGISQIEHAKQVKSWKADGVIVGSAIVKRLAENDPVEGLKSIADFCLSLKEAIA